MQVTTFEFRVQDFWFRVKVSRSGAQGSGFRVKGLDFRGWGLGFGLSAVGFRV